MKQPLGHPDHHDQDTTASEFTFVPADYTVNCSDEMPMDDAVALTTAVRSPSRCQAKPLQAMPRRLHIVRTFTATDDAGNSSSASQTITVQDTTAPEFTFVPADYTVECSDEMPMDDAVASDNCGGHHRGVQRNHCRRCRRQPPLFARSLQPTMLKQRSATQTITVQDTTAPEFAFVPADYTVECSGRDAHGRRCGV